MLACLESCLFFPYPVRDIITASKTPIKRAPSWALATSLHATSRSPLARYSHAYCVKDLPWVCLSHPHCRRMRGSCFLITLSVNRARTDQRKKKFSRVVFSVFFVFSFFLSLNRTVTVNRVRTQHHRDLGTARGSTARGSS